MARSIPQSFSEITTIKTGGRLLSWHEVGSITELDSLISRQENYFLIGGGSNIIAADSAFDGPVISLGDKHHEHRGSEGIEVGAGAVLDECIQWTINEGYGDLAALSGIPGTVGGAIVQNAGAYGVEIGQHVQQVYLYDTQLGSAHWQPVSFMNYQYRNSIVKGNSRYIVLAALLHLTRGEATVTYKEVATSLGVSLFQRVPAADLREHVLRLRAAKGMIVSAEDPSTWGVGSFFTNPIIPAASSPPAAPQYPAGPGMVKIPAAWLIENSGFPRGFPGAKAPVRLSSKHALAIINPGGGTTTDVLNLARTIRVGVQDRFGIRLVPEPICINCSI